MDEAIGKSNTSNQEDMSVTIIDNNDLMLIISTPNSGILHTLAQMNAFKKWHRIAPDTWLVRCSFSSFNVIHSHLQSASFRIVLVRFTTGTQYFSSDPADRIAGHNLIG